MLKPGKITPKNKPNTLDPIPEEFLPDDTKNSKEDPVKIIEGLESAKKSIEEAINALGKEKQGIEM